MSDSELLPDAAPQTGETAATPADRAPLFGQRPPEKTPVPVVAWVVAGLVVLLLLGGLLLVSHHEKADSSPHALQPLAAQASTLAFSDLALSESTSLSGGKSTYLDGVVRNQGQATVTGVTVQVVFANDEGMPPEIETVPLSLIRTRQPYVDIEPVSAEPLAPGTQHEFRLIFENIGANWNQSLPQLRVVRVETR